MEITEEDLCEIVRETAGTVRQVAFGVNDHEAICSTHSFCSLFKSGATQNDGSNYVCNPRLKECPQLQFARENGRKIPTLRSCEERMNHLLNPNTTVVR